MDIHGLKVFIRSSIAAGQVEKTDQDDEIFDGLCEQIKNAAAKDPILGSLSARRLPVSVLNFIDRLCRTDAPKRPRIIQEAEQKQIDKICREELAKFVAMAYSSLVAEDPKQATKVIESIERNGLKDQVKRFYRTGLQEYKPVPDDIPIALAANETDPNSFIPMLARNDDPIFGRKQHQFTLADLVLLFKLELLPKGINFMDSCLEANRGRLGFAAMKAFRSVLKPLSMNVHFFDLEGSSPVNYPSNEAKAKDLNYLITNIDFSGTSYRTYLLRDLSNIANEILECKRIGPEMITLVRKLASILTKHGKRSLADASSNHFGPTLEKIAEKLELVS